MKNYKLRIASLLTLLSFVALLPATASEFSDYTIASQRFSQLVAYSVNKQSMPLVSEPDAAKLLATLSDHHRFLETRPFTNQDLGSLVGMCEAANRAAMAYVLFDLGRYLDKSIRNPVVAAQITATVASRNVVKYQDEVTPLLAFHNRCLAKELPLVTEFAAKLNAEEFTAVRREGLAQARRGVYASYINMVRVAIDSTVSLRNRRDIFTVMVEVSPLYAQILNLEARQQAYDYLGSQADSIPIEFIGPYRQLLKDLNSTSCEGLCRL